MTTHIEETETRSFEADVARLLHMMVHSVYSDRDVFLRELVSNAADACEKLRYEAITTPGLMGEDTQLAITISAEQEAHTLAVKTGGVAEARGATRSGGVTCTHSRRMPRAEARPWAS